LHLVESDESNTALGVPLRLLGFRRRRRENAHCDDLAESGEKLLQLHDGHVDGQALKGISASRWHTKLQIKSKCECEEGQAHTFT
jgi:hypothetical protein